MTTQRAIKILNQMLLDCKDCAKMDALAIAIAILEKENEPAPAEADTSSKNNNLQLNDTAKLKICQDVIDKIAKCSSDAWARGYCQAAIDVMEAGGHL